MVKEDDISDPSGFVSTSFVKFIEHILKNNFIVRLDFNLTIHVFIIMDFFFTQVTLGEMHLYLFVTNK